MADEPIIPSPNVPKAEPMTEPLAQEAKLERTRTSSVWIAVILFIVVLLILVIFIAQNSQQVKISFIGNHGHLGLAVAMLISAIAGALLVVLAGGARILQLRRLARHKNKMSVRQ